MLNRGDRSQIHQAVLACRRLLEEEFDQLLRAHGLLPDRKVSVPAERADMQSALEEALAREGHHYVEARGRYLKHAAFTFLNRVLALRVAEANRLVAETVVARPEYGGRSRREYDLADADPELAADPERLAQEALGQGFAKLRDYLPILFYEADPYSLLWPRLAAYRRLREILDNVPEHLWREFETLGWAYQFFNSQEREEIRRELRRNPKPDHIPPLNQFYTVGWIVRALVHNTLGRLWLEAYPDSPLKEKLDYFVPIQNNFTPPGRPLAVEEIKVLDPACGSGHFLLGAFDLLLDMWKEQHPGIPAWQIPALILERNLYGVDVDLRACQIAALALWLKARTAFEDLKQGDPSARFEPKRINILCADVRFTDGGRRRRFLEGFDDHELRRIAEEMLSACENAFEIGSLLRLRQPFEQLFARRVARLEELKKETRTQLAMFISEGKQLALADLPVPVPKPLTIEEIVDRIRRFVREASEANDMGSRFFGLAAEQAAHLVDVLTERYDVVLMNPPYGAMPAGCKEYARRNYPRNHSDYYAAFIEQAVDLCREGGYVGALTGRTFLFLKSFQSLREEVLRRDALPEIVWDLGFNVLDEATARYAAFTLRRRHTNDGVDWAEHPVTFFRLTDWAWEEKREAFERALGELRGGLAVDGRASAVRDAAAGKGAGVLQAGQCENVRAEGETMADRPTWCVENVLAKSSRPGYPDKKVSLDTVEAWLARVEEMGIRSIICLLTPKEQMEYYPQLPGGLPAHYARRGFRVEHLPITDPAHDERGWQELETNLELVYQKFKELPKPVLIHCSAGVDRTGQTVSYIQERLREETADAR